MHLRYLLALFLLQTVNGADLRCENSKPSRLITINPSDLPDPLPFGYSQIRVDTEALVAHVSGQVAVNKSGEIVGSTLQEQLVEVRRNLMIALEAVEATLDDIKYLNTYLVDFVSERDMPVWVPFGKSMGNQVGTHIGVEKLAFEGLLVEAEMHVAVSREFVSKIQCF